MVLICSIVNSFESFIIISRLKFLEYSVENIVSNLGVIEPIGVTTSNEYIESKIIDLLPFINKHLIGLL